MKALATLVARGSDKQYVFFRAKLYGFIEPIRGFRAGLQLATADVNDVRAVLNGLGYGPREIELRTRGNCAVRPIRENRHDQTPAAWRYPLHRSTVLPEYDAGYVGSVPRGGTVICWLRRKCLNLGEIHTLKTGMGLVNRTV